MLNLLPSLLSLALVAHASITQSDFTGSGHISVLASSDWQTATPQQRVGCLNDHGKLIKGDDETEDCGVFTRMNDYPYTLSTKEGNCTFNDDSQPKNTDSHYGQTDNAWNCNATYHSDIYDELYTINGFPYVFLCFGDVACYYDAKHVPAETDILSLWQFHWGAEQMGITPGHVQLQLLWETLGDTTKREGANEIPGPRVEIQDGLQVPLEGGRTKG